MDYPPELEGAELFYTDDRVKAKQWFDEYTSRDARNDEDSRDARLYVEEIPSHVGVYLRYGDVEFPARYVESIKVTKVGEPPSYMMIGNDFLSSWSRLSEACFSAKGQVCAVMATPTRIEVRTISGNVFVIYPNRHVADQVLSQLLDAWHRNR